MQKPAIAIVFVLLGCADSDSPTCETTCTGGKLDGNSLLAPVDLDRGLRADWAPGDLMPLPRAYRVDHAELRLRAAASFVELADAAYFAGHDFYCGASYRSFGAQCLAAALSCAGVEPAGHSEHQLGTACEVIEGGELLASDSPASHWLDAHAHEFGFVLAGARARYVGRQAAAQLYTRGITTLELAAEMTPDRMAAIEADAIATPEAVALLCGKYERTGLATNLLERCR